MSETNQQRVNEDASIPVGMRPGLRQLKSAQLRVTIPDSVPPHMRPKMRELSEMYVPGEDRGHHLATALLNFVCQEADANHITLLLLACEFSMGEDDAPSLSESQLVAWYTRFGFQALQPSGDEGTLMARRVVNRHPNKLIHQAILKAMRH